MRELFLMYPLLLKVASQTKFIWLNGYTKFCGTVTFWRNHFLSEVLFQSLYFLRTPAFFKAVIRLRKSYFSRRCCFFRKTHFWQLTSFLQLHFLFILWYPTLLIPEFSGSNYSGVHRVGASPKYFLLNTMNKSFASKLLS